MVFKTTGSINDQQSAIISGYSVISVENPISEITIAWEQSQNVKIRFCEEIGDLPRNASWVKFSPNLTTSKFCEKLANCCTSIYTFLTTYFVLNPLAYFILPLTSIIIWSISKHQAFQQENKEASSAINDKMDVGNVEIYRHNTSKINLAINSSNSGPLVGEVFFQWSRGEDHVMLS